MSDKDKLREIQNLVNGVGRSGVSGNGMDMLADAVQKILSKEEKYDWVTITMDVKIKQDAPKPTEEQWLLAAKILGAEGFTYSKPPYLSGCHWMKKFNGDTQ